jgi:hypothetical protein
VRDCVKVFLASLVALSLVHCNDVSRFTTKTGQNYCGSITESSFVRSGIDVQTTMRLELNADRLQDAPGRLWLNRALASGEQINGAHLKVIAQSNNDPLSTLTFGEGRLKNVISFIDTSEGQLTLVLSLMQNEQVEVRLLRGPGALRSDSGLSTAVFGVFHLSKTDGTCWN